MNSLKVLKAASDINSKINKLFDGSSSAAADADVEVETRPPIQPPGPPRSSRVLFEQPVHAWKPRLGSENWQTRYAIVDPNGQLTISRGPDGNLSDTLKLKGLPRNSFYIGEDIVNCPNYTMYFNKTGGNNFDIQQSAVIVDPYHNNKAYPLSFQSRIDLYKFTYALKKCGAYVSQTISTAQELHDAEGKNQRVVKKVAAATTTTSSGTAYGSVAAGAPAPSNSHAANNNNNNGSSGGIFGFFCCGPRAT